MGKNIIVFFNFKLMPLTNKELQNFLKNKSLTNKYQMPKNTKNKRKKNLYIASIRNFKERNHLLEHRRSYKSNKNNVYKYRAKDVREKRLNQYENLKDESINFEQMDYQTSKYLGGDLKHTHMVKGLDYILLNRIREKNETSKKEKRDQKNNRTKEENICQAENHFKKNWNSTFARDVLELVRPDLILPNLNNFKNQNFIQGRMIYHFSTSSKIHQPLPKIQLTAKKINLASKNTSSLILSPSLIKRVNVSLKVKSKKNKMK